MAVRIGKTAKVTLSTTMIAELGTYTYSGFTVDAIEVTAFGDEAKDFIPGMGDPGTIDFAGNYDPTDTAGQIALETACESGTGYGPGAIRFYLNQTQYLTPKGGGEIIITKVKAITMEKSGVGTIAFSAKVSGAGLELLNA